MPGDRSPIPGVAGRPEPEQRRLSAMIRRGPCERLAAWVVTGPPGHFWSPFADLAAYLARSLGRRLRGRRPGHR
jgi:hypothetical protein